MRQKESPSVPIETLLIANRGEIACRIIKTARRMGIRCVAVYSDADAGAMHVRLADEAHAIGPAPASESYLVAERILEAARRSGADAIHPGYGFLAENADFARMCEERGIRFVGPPAEAIRSMAEKDVAKQIMRDAGVPVIPGVDEEGADEGVLRERAREVGYPLLIKAVAGGGGRGMRVVSTADEFDAALEAARREATASFGNGRVILEKLVSPARHVEVQIFADRHGNAVHLFERDCSIQRRHQKIVEEAPAPGLAAALRSAMGEAAVQAARAIGYRGAGTVEFLLDLGEPSGDTSNDWPFYFMEMNTRLQVEHPVTEMITGVDLVEWQLREAAGEPVPLCQEEITPHGHSIEVRICAENCEAGFLPAAGPIIHFGVPDASDDLRLETGVESGDGISVHYDSMIAKLVVWGPDRASALRRLRGALERVNLAGIPSNVALLSRIASDEVFAEGGVDSGYLDRHADALLAVPESESRRLLALACLEIMLAREAQAKSLRSDARSVDRFSPWAEADGWRLNQDSLETLEFTQGREVLRADVRRCSSGTLVVTLAEEVLEIAGRTLEWCPLASHDARLHRFEAEIEGERREFVAVQHDGDVTIFDGGRSTRLGRRDLPSTIVEERETVGAVTTPIPGKVTEVRVGEGDRVRKGDVLVVLEAMKMEHKVCAALGAVVESLNVALGDQVEDGATLLVLS